MTDIQQLKRTNAGLQNKVRELSQKLERAERENGRFRREVQSVAGLIDDEVLATLEPIIRGCPGGGVAHRLEFAVSWVKHVGAGLQSALSRKENDDG
ncbi:hypothetical protein CAI21_22325 [Alkalilimnicola ehrlichii]|uniref:Uncharacterized protein n=1 Tax=Alkalilimnicola ehrlichii TaxID=351052 RepID=A0A3E0WQE9_9GAMM|nr:hypothetical protein [Alkalilimnicola ehrlichii]RFA24272.1 hypothetical protein CAI21_22325 [Alkalilimnicola ehrlichii]RFA35174.1 hypothetical protein CAL65_13805 [Alkalilimnicola ehrlichii]